MFHCQLKIVIHQGNHWHHGSNDRNKHPCSQHPLQRRNRCQAGCVGTPLCCCWSGAGAALPAGRTYSAASWIVSRSTYLNHLSAIFSSTFCYINHVRYTAGIVGGLSTVAVCAPSEKFLYMGGPLAIGFGVVFAASLGSAFLPPTTALGAGLYSLSLYGGLLLFSGFLLYHTQHIVRAAEVHPRYAAVPYDPVNRQVISQ